MGIKGIYAQLGPGQRVSLSKLSATSLRETSRPLRLAIDFAIWHFQTQAAQGGINPACRTLFYRLVRLLGTPIQPIFVFDGPHKPVFKRNKRSGRGDGLAAAQAKKLIRLFGFLVHDAPGEAEAECALLQQRGVVDAVLSEDVDTIMFGCTRTLRNWSAEGKSSKTPTHVSLYDVNDMSLANLGLDREGMVLVALMSGGDYLPDGIPGCGVKVACEAAKAGFGKSVCRLKASDKKGIQEWREKLVHELQTNESKFFRTKHKALSIPTDFPNLEVLRYYTHPVVSPQSTVDSIAEKLEQRRSLQLDLLREFARETFGWDFKIGAIKFIRVMGPALLIQKMQHHEAGYDGTIKKISGSRTHFTTDAESELRLSYIPEEVVPIDLSQEVEETIATSRDGLALNSDDEFETPDAEVPTGTAKVFDVTKPDLAWVLEDVVKRTAPDVFAEWEEAVQAKAQRKSPTKKKSATTKGGTGGKSAKSSDMPRGALDKFMKVTKSTLHETTGNKEKAIPKDVSPPKSIQPLPSSPLRDQSKHTTPWDPSEPVRLPADHSITARSRITPSRSSRKANSQETIVLSSSPAAPSPPASPSPRPRASASNAQKVFGNVRSGPAPSQASQGLKGNRRTTRAKTAATSSRKDSTNSSGIDYKQTSMDMFTTRADPFTSSQPSMISLDEESEIDLPPLNSEPFSEPALPPQFPKSRKSPSKRQKSPPGSEREFSPTRAGRKKVLLPDPDALGFFKELEVEAEERDAVLDREARRLESKGKAHKVVRYSDVSFVDLTQNE